MTLPRDWEVLKFVKADFARFISRAETAVDEHEIALITREQEMHRRLDEAEHEALERKHELNTAIEAVRILKEENARLQQEIESLRTDPQRPPVVYPAVIAGRDSANSDVILRVETPSDAEQR